MTELKALDVETVEQLMDLAIEASASHYGSNKQWFIVEMMKIMTGCPETKPGEDAKNTRGMLEKYLEGLDYPVVFYDDPDRWPIPEPDIETPRLVTVIEPGGVG